MRNKITSISKKQLLALFLIVVGLVMVVNYGYRTFVAYRALEYARSHNFDQGNPDPGLVRPWMSLEYIAVAYAVPLEFLYAQLHIPLENPNSHASLGDINREFRAEQPDAQGRPIIMAEVRAAILAYRADPVPTGLVEGGVRLWMTIQYIANSTGIPPETIFEQIGVPMSGHAYIDLNRLADVVHYEGGPHALIADLQKIVDSHQETP